RRQTCRRQFLDQSLEGVIHQWNISDGERCEEFFPLNADDPDSDGETLSDVGSIERWLRRAVARRLGIRPEDICLDEPLARYGVDSLNAMELGHELERRLGVVISSSTWMAGPGVALLAAEANKLAQTAELGALPKEAANGGAENEFPLSYGQIAFW